MGRHCTTLGLVLLIGHATANACTPALGYAPPTLEQRYERAYIVALVRVKAKNESERGVTAQVEVVKSFKGPVSFNTVSTTGSTCGMRLWIGEQSIVFLDTKHFGMGTDSLLEGDIAKALPVLRRLKSSK